MEELWYFISKNEEPNPFDSVIVVKITTRGNDPIEHKFSCHESESIALAEAYDWINRNYPEALPTTSKLPSRNPELPDKIQNVKRDAFYLGVLCILTPLAGFCLSALAIIPGVAIATVGMHFHGQLLSIMYGHSMGVNTGNKFARNKWNSIWGNMTNQEIDHYQATHLPQLFLDRCKWLHAKSMKFGSLLFGRNYVQVEQDTVEIEQLRTVLHTVEEIRKAERFMNPATIGSQ